MGEKFAANPVTGTGSMSVPIATSPGRSGFGPQLSLSYDSGAGNGPFGFGWSLSLPSITRKTDKGLPQYLDAIESDVFILSGAEDLVPVYRQDPDGTWIAGRQGFQRDADGFWVRDASGRLVVHEDEFNGYHVWRYRPRIEGLFARIERWSKIDSPGDVHWRSISKDNILTLYGYDENSRIADPLDASRIFSWLICESRDDKGNGIRYLYKEENGAYQPRPGQADPFNYVHQRNRGPASDSRRTAQRYLHRVLYGNRMPFLNGEGRRPRFLNDLRNPPSNTSSDWLFEVRFDYGELDENNPTGQPEKPWFYRPDAFSSYRSGFEVRTCRRCERVLMLHHIPDQPEDVSRAAHPGYQGVVRSTDFTYDDEINPNLATRPIYSFLKQVIQTGWKQETGATTRSSLPPVEFTYTKPVVQEVVEEIDPASLQNLPVGLDGSTYRWTDLHGEGIPGILTEQAGTWFYKRNRSPLPQRQTDGSEVVKAHFAPLETVALKPNLALSSGAEFMDLAGDGQPDLVDMDGPTPGFYEHDEAEGWQPFRPFTSHLNRDLRDPNLKFIDLDGDGHADLLITEDEAFVWHASLAEEGFGPARRVAQALDEETGPRIVLADGTQSIFLADLSGDGLTDLVRIRNGEVSYWPNLGYCRFGAKVTMDGSPWFDNPDQFDHKRIRLADIDGSGTTDIIYLHRDGVRLYFNQSGNSWSQPQILTVFPRIDDLASIVPIDLLGNGTACLVWSSALPDDTSSPMRYIDLMGGQKPNLLVKTKNNLGAETEIQYAPSTKFYLADRLAGNPWITKLPFPVHVVEKVTLRDIWRNTCFSSRYSYHHGYFDGAEREFRGFGRVEQIDTESFGEFVAGNAGSPYITDDHTLYQPPVKTITWFHTGAFLDRERIISQFRSEYCAPQADRFEHRFEEHTLPETDLAGLDLSAQEWREALRACKGMLLRQEVYELDVDALAHQEEQRIKLFSTAFHNCHIQRLQPREDNRHAVFLVTESEAITYHYELDLTGDLPPDPRIAHTLNLRIDEYGNALESVAVAYPRIGRYREVALPEGAEALITRVQQERHLVLTQNTLTNDVSEIDNHRLRLPCEVKTHELTGLQPASGFYYNLAELQEAMSGDAATDIPYHVLPNRTDLQKRQVEWVRTLYFSADLETPLPWGELNQLALPYETYKLALTDELLDGVFLPYHLTTEVRSNLATPNLSGYLCGLSLAECFPDLDTSGQYWLRSGVAGFAADAAGHFYLPERYADPFGNITLLEYDGRFDLFIQSSRDPIGNITRIVEFDYRVLAPREMEDINGNRSEVRFDVLGLPTAMAVKGKGIEGDELTLGDDLIDIDATIRRDFFINSFNTDEARRLLGNASTRNLYYFGETRAADGTVRYGNHPPCTAAISREQHVANLAAGAQSPLQIAFEYSDGGGNVLVKKMQAEPEAPGGPLRWIASGKTVLNNKGKPVKQYEPYFSADERGEPDHRFEEPREVGVTPLLYYDAAGRQVRTEMPDGTYSRVVFSPWFMATWDASDTVLETGNDWYARRTDPTHPRFTEFGSAPNQRAAELAAMHANTPTVIHMDSLGRAVVAVAHNRFEREGTVTDEQCLTYSKLDIEGKPLWIQDARGNRVMEYINRPGADSDYVPCYDIAGHLLFQHSMDGGDRWLLTDATGQPFYAWDVNERVNGDGTLVLEPRRYHTTYDDLRRPLEQQLQINVSPATVVERFVYGESHPEAALRNLRGQVYQHYDPSGLMANQRFDFKGNLLEVSRQLTQTHDASVVDWNTETLSAEVFTQRTSYDALNRMTRLENWHRADHPPAIYIPRYNPRGILASESLSLRGTVTDAIVHIDYDEKGQRTEIQYGNGTTTHYHYNPETFRLVQLRTTLTSPSERLPTPPSNLSDSNVVQNLYYTYDPVGNITEIRDDAYEPVFFRNQRVEPRNTYIYDALYRLIEATGRENYQQEAAPQQKENAPFSIRFPVTDQALRNYSQTYTYDPVGNILQMRHMAERGNWTRHYEYAPDSNRLLWTWLGDDRLNAVEYAYDTHGSMLNLANTPEAYRLQWDYRDMIHAVNLGGGGQAFYNYDSGKQRIRKRIEHHGNRLEERLYLGGMELYRRWTGEGTSRNLVEEIETHHLFVDDQRVLIVEDVLATDDSRLDAGVLYRYQYSNHLGSVGLEMTGNAEIISYEEYHPYGTTAYRGTNATMRAAAKRFRYTGMERDEETGLSCHMARFYLPWLGRWVSIDPIDIKGGFNLYLYAKSNPFVFMDRAGEQDEEPGRTERRTPSPRRRPELSRYGLTFTAEAARHGITAQQVFDWIQENPHIPDWMKGVFVLRGDTIFLRERYRIPPGVTPPPTWWNDLTRAISEGDWEVTSGELQISDRDQSTREITSSTLVPDFAIGDQPGRRHWEPIRQRHEWIEEIGTIPNARGTTIPSERMGGAEATGYIGPRMRSEPVSGRGTDGIIPLPTPGRSRGSEPGYRGLIVVASRESEGGTTQTIDPNAFLETLFHELADHAGPIVRRRDEIRRTSSSEVETTHGTYSVDRRAIEIDLFFGIISEVEAGRRVRELRRMYGLPDYRIARPRP